MIEIMLGAIVILLFYVAKYLKSMLDFIGYLQLASQMLETRINQMHDILEQANTDISEICINMNLLERNINEIKDVVNLFEKYRLPSKLERESWDDLE